ncbi:hypothetical protein [Nitrosomonas sp.]|uniref:hypothetical protein n=1 Tax=Nitrosomonas sp. TaxID=42353 RepID=UPI00284BECD5|nr:hypothetical protein [Nitrosomonas sp.]MDR4513499.1 hypothetical protein [Nitrosomonas sp.]
MNIFINKRSTEDEQEAQKSFPEFKSKVVLAAVKGDKTLTELSQQYGINSNLIVKWKRQLIDQSSEVMWFNRSGHFS